MEIKSKAQNFIYKNARPLDLARWNYLFENGDKNEVIKYLKGYQNPDGGFSSALEADCWNPNSTPMQTWVATRIIKQIHLEDKKHTLITGILHYLSSQAEFDGHCWNGLSKVKSNNDYPHAPWWEYQKEQKNDYNPTASLIGFILKYAEETETIYQTACTMKIEAYAYLKKNYPLESMHEVAAFVELYEYLKESKKEDSIDLAEFRTLLKEQIKHVVTYDTSTWNTAYVCKPSLFIQSRESDFYEDNKEICEFESEFIKKMQKENGTWDVTWGWNKDQEQWSISKNWWKSDIIIKNMLYMKNFTTRL